MDNIRKAVWLAAAALSTPALAQFNFPGNGNGNGNGNGGGFGFGGFSLEPLIQRRVAHGVLASVAFVVLFPLGAIAMALIRGRWAVRVHALIQMVAFVLFIAAAALGFKMVREVNFAGAGGEDFFLNYTRINYHPIIGIVLFILVVFQPALGWLHHRNFVKYRRRTLVSYLHLFNGRVLIILGIVNGGLGLRITRASEMAKRAYTIVAAVIGGIWLIVTVLGEVRKSRARDGSTRGAGDSGDDHVRTAKGANKTRGGEGGGPGDGQAPQDS